jgi:hypothetical protein
LFAVVLQLAVASERLATLCAQQTRRASANKCVDLCTHYHIANKPINLVRITVFAHTRTCAKLLVALHTLVRLRLVMHINRMLQIVALFHKAH